MEAPEFTTERLRFRSFRKTDFDASFELWADPEIYHHLMGRPCSPEECWSRVLRYAGHWNWFGYGYWAIEDKATGAFIGEMGFADFHRAIEPPLGNRIETGWILASRMHRRKLGTEALQAMLRWGDGNLPSRELAAIIAPENLASARLAERAGFIKSHTTVYNGDTTLVFHRN